MESALVKKSIEINAPAETVWQVLINAEMIRQWDDLPEDFSERQIKLHSEIVWKMEERTTKLTITAFDPRRYLRMNLFVSTWPSPETSYDIAYSYTLTERDKITTLHIEVGDFTPLGDKKKDYYDASVEFAETASLKIKSLAEKK